MGALSGIIGGGIKNTAAALLTGQEKKEGGISVGGGSLMDNRGKDHAPEAPEEAEKSSDVEGLTWD